MQKNILSVLITILIFVGAVSCSRNNTSLSSNDRSEKIRVEVIQLVVKDAIHQYDSKVGEICTGGAWGEDDYFSNDEKIIKGVSILELCESIQGVLSKLPRDNSLGDGSYLSSNPNSAMLGVSFTRDGWKHYVDFSLTKAEEGVRLQVWHKGVSRK